MRIKIVLLTVFYIIFASNPSYARYSQPDLEKIPIQRLIENLQAKHESNPENNHVLFALARTYAMAFASKEAEIRIKKGWEGFNYATPWFGYNPRKVPYSKQKLTNNNKSQEAYQGYLDMAIKLHKKALNNDPDNLLIKIGLTWCLEQNGDIEEAISGYRHIVKMAWKGEKEKKRLFGYSPLLTEEASQYLIPLLDPVKDIVEITQLKEYKKYFEKLPRSVTPIVIPLNENIQFNHLKDNPQYVIFDLDGSGIPKKWEWINPDFGFLVFDKNQTKEIKSALQLFGNVTFWLFWDNGYSALQSLDDNNDGQLTKGELKGLAIWQDINQNGKSEQGEIKSLSDWGIIKLSCNYELQEDGTPYSSSGVLFADGKVRASYDIYLKSQDLSSVSMADDLNHD